MVQKIRTGFRPKTAQHRGGQKPLVEPQVTLECFKKQAIEYVYRYLPFSAPNPTIEVDEAPLTEDICSSSASESDGSSQPNEEVDAQEKPVTLSQTYADSEFDEIILAKHRRVTLAMVVRFLILHNILKSIGVRHVVPTCPMMIQSSYRSGITQCLFVNIQDVRKPGRRQECSDRVREQQKKGALISGICIFSIDLVILRTHFIFDVADFFRDLIHQHRDARQG